MKITFNGETVTTRAHDLATLLVERGLGDAYVATALDGRFVPAHAREGATLTEGCAVEALAPMQGG